MKGANNFRRENGAACTVTISNAFARAGTN
jgi:hypothetical protein